jgi:hypothetical protein
MSGVGRIRVGGGARRSSVQRRSRGRPRKKDCCIGRATMVEGGERRGRGGDGRLGLEEDDGG